MWYILNYVPSSARKRQTLPALIEAFSATASAPVELFAPTFVSVTTEDGKVKRTVKPLLYHYIFVRGEEADVKRLCSSYEGFSFVLDRASEKRHLTVSDETIRQFRIIARYYGNRLPCYPLEGVKLEEGDKVQIVDGPCAGLTGTYISRKGGKSGNILVAVDHSLAAVVYDIRADYVRVLEFAKNSRRVYDQLDSFSERLSEFLGQMTSSAAEGKGLESIIPAATVFARRLGAVRINNPKISARLAILLYAAYCLLGDKEKAAGAMEKYRSLSTHVTNPKTIAFNSQILSWFKIG